MKEAYKSDLVMATWNVRTMLIPGKEDCSKEEEKEDSSKEEEKEDCSKEEKKRLFKRRRKGRPCLRWMEDVVADLTVMKIKQWMEKIKDREQKKTDC
jgi:hypothetical protein